MPRPMTNPRPEPGDEHGQGTTPIERPSARQASRPPAEHDRSGRELAVRLPEWDLVPPTEFLDRTGGR